MENNTIVINIDGKLYYLDNTNWVKELSYQNYK